MMKRRRGIFADAFTQTYYNRAIAEEQPLKTGLYGFLGLPYTKYKVAPEAAVPAPVEEQDPTSTLDTSGIADQATQDKIQDEVVLVEKDRNIFNWIEQFVFLPFRLVKNTAKLATEFLPNAIANVFARGAKYFFDKAEAIKTLGKTLNDEGKQLPASTQAELFLKYWFNNLAGALFTAVSFVPRLVAKVGQSITSPFAALKQTQNAVEKATGYKLLGRLASTLHLALIVVAYAGLTVFAAPLIAPALSPILGTQWTTALMTNLGVAVNWFGSLPVISSIGAAFTTALTTVASFMGLSLPSAGFASAAALAVTALFATPVLAGLKAVVRYISPFKSKFIEANNSQEPGQGPMTASSNLTGLPKPQDVHPDASLDNAHDSKETSPQISPRHSDTHPNRNVTSSSSSPAPITGITPPTSSQPLPPPAATPDASKEDKTSPAQPVPTSVTPPPVVPTTRKRSSSGSINSALNGATPPTTSPSPSPVVPPVIHASATPPKLPVNPNNIVDTWATQAKRSAQMGAVQVAARNAAAMFNAANDPTVDAQQETNPNSTVVVPPASVGMGGPSG